MERGIGGATVWSVNCQRVGICDSRLIFVGLMSRDRTTFTAASRLEGMELRIGLMGRKVIGAFGAMILSVLSFLVLASRYYRST